ncbi:hypothetical protein [Nocardia aurea]|uniref:Serine/threonine protein kinase n=1 Tax=Nocardia aurea TaxID=2144174 RepID=A0ABV3FMF5_9NOCA
MKRLGPWLTLGVVAVLGLILLSVNMSKDTAPTAAQPTATPAAATTTVAPASSTAAAPPTTTAAPAPGAFPAQADYVGKIAPATGGTLTLEITVEGDRAVAYLCDGASVESWLRGSAVNGRLQLTGKNDATLDGAATGSGVGGSVSVAGKRWDYTAAPVTPPAGLYVYSDNGVRQSWIVDSSGAVTGVQRAADGATSPAPALASDATALVGGKKITANKVSGGDDVG